MVTNYQRGPKPRFEVGQEVISFRGERGTVAEVIPSRQWRHKSHRVVVNFTHPSLASDNTAYYEEVFEPYEESHD